MRTLVDLHNHSCLSPCASLEMSPSALCRIARERGLGVLALTDHNSARNCPAFAEACGREGLAPLFGIEACSVEEVHVLCIFETLDEVLDFGAYLEERLPTLPYDPAKLGDQVVVDVDENVLELPQRYLGAALSLGFGELCRAAADRGALVIPAHVDRGMFSVSSQLGFLPPGPYDAVEAVRRPAAALTRGLAAVSGSDAHYPGQIAARPFVVDMPEELTAPRPRGGSERFGPALLGALRGKLGLREVRAAWEREA
ncbi:MAG: PHP domain-containing protein [Treponema sp.]|nr:PHP domain-containing protein [Treponema sp.]